MNGGSSGTSGVGDRVMRVVGPVEMGEAEGF